MMLRNVDIADIFDEIADLLDLKQENPFRIRAYRNAARLLRGLKSEAATLIASGKKLSDLPGIGADLAGKIADLVETGGTELLFRLRRDLPPGLRDFLKVPGLGPKRAKLLYDKLELTSIATLHKAAAAGKLKSIKGLGPKVEATILAATEARKTEAPRMLRWRVQPIVADLVAYLATAPGIGKVSSAGSFRRGRETVGDIDILATGGRGNKVIEHFVAFAEVRRVLAKGGTRATVQIAGGLQVDLRVVATESFGAALVYFTGSKAHNIAIRKRGQVRGLKINEYGVYRGAKRLAGDTEASVYRSLGLAPVAPELREDRGEIEAAAARRLPQLIERSDLKGDLHCHTKESDGQDSLADMVAGARRAGLSYLAITEHSRRLTVAHGLDARRLGRRNDAIDKFNAGLKGFRVLKGIEVDILEDGSLDLPDSALKDLDLVIGAIHSHFHLPAKKQTDRLLRAIGQPFFSILAHPSGRLIGEREGSDFDLARVMEAVRQRGSFLELNAQPERLDIDDIQCRMAREAGVLVAIGSDAHAAGQFDYLDGGILQARRGWLEAKHVLNTHPLGELLPLLRRTKLR